MIRKVIWLRCQEESEIDEIQESIMSFIKEDASLAGDIPVRVFSEKGFSKCSLSHIYDMSESAVNVLKEKFGDENVKLCKKEADNSSNMGNTSDQLADVLERINDNLSCICTYLECISDNTGTLSDCVSESRYGNRFCITGDITHYEP